MHTWLKEHWGSGDVHHSHPRQVQLYLSHSSWKSVQPLTSTDNQVQPSVIVNIRKSVSKVHYQSPLLSFKPIFSGSVHRRHGEHIPFLFVAALTYLKTIILPLLSFLFAKQLKSHHQSLTGCIFQPSDYYCYFLLKSLQQSTLSLTYSTPHDTLQLRPS